MVKEIKAYRADDGSVFNNYSDAVRHDAEMQLAKVFNGNIGLINTVLDNAVTISTVLRAMCDDLTALNECGNVIERNDM